jgi:hypothetical protein
MNAVAHCSAGLASILKEDDLNMLTYVDSAGGQHRGISKYPWIILQAKNSNQLASLRRSADDHGIAFTDFTHTMLGNSAEDQLTNTKSVSADELDYFLVCLYGAASELEPLTKKFSVYRTSNDTEGSTRTE